MAKKKQTVAKKKQTVAENKRNTKATECLAEIEKIRRYTIPGRDKLLLIHDRVYTWLENDDYEDIDVE